MIYMKFIDKIKAKIAKFGQDSIHAYIDYQVMCTQPTLKEPYNENWTKVFESENGYTTCCCGEPVIKPDDGSTPRCPKCDLQVMFTVFKKDA